MDVGPGGMAAAVTQDGHLLAIETALGPDALLLTSVDGTDTISRGFTYRIEFLTMASDDQLRGLLGNPLTLWVANHAGGVRRPLNGHLRHLVRGERDNRAWRNFSAEVVPWMWFLSRSVDCRIYQNLSVPDILAGVFQQFGLVNVQFRLDKTYPKLEFCVQYRESALAFVSRLMEHVGIFYWFEHSADKHLLVVADGNNMASFTDPRQLVLSNRPELGQIQSFTHALSIRPGAVALNDFDYEMPRKNLRAHEPSIISGHPLSGFEIYDYPGAYADPAEGAKLARLRMEEEEAQHLLHHGTSSFTGLDPGRRFELAGDTPEAAPPAFLVTQVHHRATDNSYYANVTDAPAYSNQFAALPAETAFRPQRLTQKPVVQGPQTATVVGPPGETIFTDHFGRVRLQFHWDRYGNSDDKSSCWVRVSQNSAGAGWGGMFIPHVGHEVVVSFLEGDPDRPIVTGRVYNGDNKKSVGLPANKTQTGLRDHSGNEIQMEGKAGVQNMHFTAVKDMNVNVKNDYNETIASGNRTMTVATGTHTETIKGNTTIRITNGNYVHRVEAGTTDRFVSGNVKEFFGDHLTTTVNSDIVMASVYSKIFIQAAMAIQLTTGASQITMESDGTITIVGKKINIIGSASVEISGDKVEAKAGSEAKIGVGGQNTVYNTQKVAIAGAAISSSAVGEHDISGAIVKIN